MRNPSLALHKAIIDRLEYATAYKIFDDLPENEDFPYIVVGEISARNWSSKFENGQEITVTLHIWSQYRGRKETDIIANEIEQALTSSDLELGNSFLGSFQKFESYDLIIDMDGITRHGIIKMRYLIEEL